MATGQARVFDDDGVGQALLAFPFLHDQRDATRVAEDGDEGGARVVLRQVRQVQRQAGADHDGVDAGFQRALHRSRVGADRAHHIDGQEAVAATDLPRGRDLAVYRFQVGGVYGLLGGRAHAQAAGAGHQIGMVAAQVDAADGAHGAQRGHAARQAVRRDAHAHAALHHRQQAAALQLQPAQAAGGQQGGQTAVVRGVAGRGTQCSTSSGSLQFASTFLVCDPKSSSPKVLRPWVTITMRSQP